MADANRCVSCGEIIPEGRMVCPTCLYKAGNNLIEAAKENLKEARLHIDRAIAGLTIAEVGQS